MPIPAARQKIIERIAAKAARLRKRNDALPVEAFIRQYYRGVAEEDLGESTPDELAGAALAHLRFAAERKRHRPLVRVYNPEGASHTIVELTTDDMPFLVDSLGMVLSQAGLTNSLMVHPVLSVRRDRGGRLVDIEESAGKA